MNGRKKDIPDFLPQWEILAQLAEESAELAQAALKLRRVLDDVNPTRISYVKAVANLNEEWADVLLSIRQLNFIDEHAVVQTVEEKHERWLRHLQEHQAEQEKEKEKR